MAKKKANMPGSNVIAQNKKARFEYHLEETFEAGLALAGWEVKSLRAGKAQLTDTYILVKSGEAWLLGCHITPLNTASTHVLADPTRTRKLLLHRREIDQLIGLAERKGYALIPTAMYFKQGRVKVEIGVAKGKKEHDKRRTTKDREWKRQKERIMKYTR